VATPPIPPRGIFEWFWRGKSLKQARAALHEEPPLQQARLRRARAALELADRAYDPIDPLRAGSSLALSVSLYREAAYWALLAQDESYAGRTLAELFEQLPVELLEHAAGGAMALREVRQALVERSFVETAELPLEALPRDALLAREFAHALVARRLEAGQRVGRLQLQRGARTFGLLLLATATIWGTVAGVQRLTLQPDLAAGKPWRASSTLDTCRPQEHLCAGAKTDMFFSTVEEKNPWFELDLGRRTRFSVVEVTNRSDCCPDRAVPLVVEVGNDRQKWHEVARRTETFATWKASFAPQEARYVRLRVPRRTHLHLEKVVVRAH
jgi:hypothetical protein